MSGTRFSLFVVIQLEKAAKVEQSHFVEVAPAILLYSNNINKMLYSQYHSLERL